MPEGCVQLHATQGPRCHLTLVIVHFTFHVYRTCMFKSVNQQAYIRFGCGDLWNLCRLFVFQGPIGRNFKTTVKIINILFATFNHIYQLLLSLHSTPT